MAPTPVLLPGESHGWRSLENPMDGGAWRATVQGVAKSQTRLSNFHFHCVHSLPFSCLFQGLYFQPSQCICEQLNITAIRFLSTLKTQSLPL